MSALALYLTVSLAYGFIIDYSGIIESFEESIRKHSRLKFFSVPKPFSCSLCMTFWTTLILSFFFGSWPLNIVWIVLSSALSTSVSPVLHLLNDIITKLIQLLYRWMKL